jgi:OmpA-OmpF porin, OOP family
MVLFGALSSVNAQNGDKYFKANEYRSATFAYENEVMTNPEKYFNLGRAYFAIMEFEKAAHAMRSYIEKYPKGDTTTARKWVQLLERPDEPVRVTNLGPVINSSENEIIPRISQDGKRLYFAAKNRPGGKGGEDIWYSNLNLDGTWSEPINFSELNTPSHEGLLSISADGQTVLLFGNYPGTFGRGDLFYSVKTPTGWSTPCNLGGTINTNAWEAQASLAPDGKTMVFVSDRKGGYGSSDLYMSQLSTTGWSNPINLGPTINTKGGEYFPQLSADGKSLYFTSTGHFGFGGRDIFVSRRLDDTWTNWSTPENLGKYINTLGDDSDFSLPASGTRAYFYRKGADGYGQNDLYYVVIPFALRPEKTVTVYGPVTDEQDSGAAVNVRFFDISSGKQVSRVSSATDNYNYLTRLAVGKMYHVEVNMKGYLYFSDTLDLSDIRKLLPPQTMSQRLAEERQSYEMHRQELDIALKNADGWQNSDSEALREGFEAMLKELKTAENRLAKIRHLVSESQYRWLSEDPKLSDVQLPIELQRSTIGASFELENIFFEFGKATLREESMSALDVLFDIMNKNDIYIELAGHTDSIGSAANNQKLSQDRVNSVKKYLEGRGIPAWRMKAIGYGAERPVADNRTEEGRQKNRRVEVVIIDRREALEGQEVDLLENDTVRIVEEATSPETFDFFETLLEAAKVGGLPKGAECGPKVQPITTTYSTSSSKTQKPVKTRPAKVKARRTYEEIALEDYYLKGFNLNVNNVGFTQGLLNPPGQTLGLKMNILTSSRLENHFQYWHQGDNFKWGAGFGQLIKWQVGKYVGLPFELVFGYQMDMFNIPNGNTTFFIEDYQFMMQMPLGFRYNQRIGGFILAPELIYNSHLLSTTGLGNVAGYRYGVGARWKFINGGFYLNRGPVMRYNGFSLGFSF